MSTKFHIEFWISLAIVTFSQAMHKIISADNMIARIIMIAGIILYCVIILTDGIYQYKKRKDSRLRIVMPIIYSIWVTIMFGMEYYLHYIDPPRFLPLG